MRRTVVALLAGLCLLATACDAKEASTPPQAVGVRSVSDSSGLPAPDFSALEDALNRDPTTVIPQEALQEIGGLEKFREAVPEGSKFTVLPRSWSPDGTGGTVAIRLQLPDGEVRRQFAILLQDVHHRWFVTATVSPATLRQLGSSSSG